MPPPSPPRDENAVTESGCGIAGGTPVVAASLPAQVSAPLPKPMSLSRFNCAPPAEISALLSRCCGSARWAVRIAACRPYPDVEAMLAALDEATYDMTPEDLAEALEAESPQLPFPGGGTEGDGDRRGVLAAHTALRAAHAAYENRFGHVFLVCLDDWHPDERLDQALAAVRSRLGSDPEEERVRAAEELRRLARGRLARLVGTAGRGSS